MIMDRKLFLVAASVALALVTVSCSSRMDTVSDAADPEGQVKTFERGGVSFEYPGDWDSQGDAPVTMEMNAESFTETIGPDENNVVVVQSAAVDRDVTQEDVVAIRDTLHTSIGALIEEGGGTVTSGPDDLEAGGGYGYTWDFTEVDLDGVSGNGTAAIFFVGFNEYVVLCVHTDQQQAIDAGCHHVLETFEVDAA